MPSFPLKVLRFRRCDPFDVNSLTVVREHNAGSARLSAAYRTDQSDRADVFWHRHIFDHGPLQADVQFRSMEKMDPELSVSVLPFLPQPQLRPPFPLSRSNSLTPFGRHSARPSSAASVVS